MQPSSALSSQDRSTSFWPKYFATDFKSRSSAERSLLQLEHHLRRWKNENEKGLDSVRIVESRTQHRVQRSQMATRDVHLVAWLGVEGFPLELLPATTACSSHFMPIAFRSSSFCLLPVAPSSSTPLTTSLMLSISLTPAPCAKCQSSSSS